MKKREKPLYTCPNCGSHRRPNLVRWATLRGRGHTSEKQDTVRCPVCLYLDLYGKWLRS